MQMRLKQMTSLPQLWQWIQTHAFGDRASAQASNQSSPSRVWRQIRTSSSSACGSVGKCQPLAKMGVMRSFVLISLLAISDLETLNRLLHFTPSFLFIIIIFIIISLFLSLPSVCVCFFLWHCSDTVSIFTYPDSMKIIHKKPAAFHDLYKKKIHLRLCSFFHACKR